MIADNRKLTGVFSGQNGRLEYTSDMSSLRARRGLLPVLLLAFISLPGCLVHRRVVTVPQHENRPALVATKEQLIQRIHDFSDSIQSFTLKADMSASVGSLYGGQVTDYPAITGYILFMRPDDIRVIGLDPVIHGTAFDMVSIANNFEVSIPPKNEFIVGKNDAPSNSPNKLENLRPVAFLHSLLITPPDPNTQYTLLEDDTNETKAVYILLIVQKEGDQLALVRNVYFNRYTLQISRQKTLDNVGNIRSDTKYAAWKTYNGVSFPSSIDIQRPQDGYEVVLTVMDMKINTNDVTAEKLVLKQPPGAQLKTIE